MLLQPVESVTHAHLIYVAASELKRRKRTGSVSLLDVGCGNGQLLLAVQRHLADLAGCQLDLHGFDVSDARIQRSDFFGKATRLLETEAPSVDWADRLDLIEAKQAWPIETTSIDVVLTNQVLEHVPDIAHFMGELRRVLRPGGICINLFPVNSMLLESHVGVPLAHRIASDDVRRSYMETFARIGLSRLGPMHIQKGQSPTEFAIGRSEYVASQVWYRSFSELVEAAHRAGLLASYRWTPEFFLLKLGYVFGRDVSGMYSQGRRRVLWDVISFPFLSRLSSVTIVLEMGELYDPDAPHATMIS